MSVCVIRIYCDQRQLRDHFQALTKNILCGDIFRSGIIGIQSEDTSLHGIHNVTIGCFHDNVTDKTSGQRFETCHDVLEYFHIFVRWKPSEHQKIDGFLKSEFTSLKSIYNIIYIISLIIQSAVCRNLTSVDQVITCNIRDLGKSGQDTLTC